MKALRWLAVLILGFLLPRAAGLLPRAVESLYSRGLFPRIASALGHIGGAIPVSLAQIILFAFPLVLIWLFLRSLRVAVRKKSFRKGFGPPHRPIAVLAVAVWAFYLLWGLNYARLPLDRRLSLARVQPDGERLARLTRVLAVEVNETYRSATLGGQLAERPEGSHFSLDRRDIAQRIDAAYGEVQPSVGGRTFSAPKFPALSGWLLTRVGLSGFYFPLTGEATVNGSMPDAAIPFTMAHEMAHQRGTAREDEANFLAYLSCRETGLAAARYSGALAAYRLAQGALWQASPDSARALGRKLLDPGPQDDQAAIIAFWRRHEGRAAGLASSVNNAYLKANAQKAGIQSYGRAVDLLLAFEAAGGMREE